MQCEQNDSQRRIYLFCLGINPSAHGKHFRKAQMKLTKPNELKDTTLLYVTPANFPTYFRLAQLESALLNMSEAPVAEWVKR